MVLVSATTRTVGAGGGDLGVDLLFVLTGFVDADGNRTLSTWTP
jgi:hypothetical protein